MFEKFTLSQNTRRDKQIFNNNIPEGLVIRYIEIGQGIILETGFFGFECRCRRNILQIILTLFIFFNSKL